MDKFSYIKQDTIGFGEKVSKAWKYYHIDIRDWTEGFQKVFSEYYVNEPKQINIESIKNKNIEKMIKFYKMEVLDPINMFLFINSVADSEKRSEVINKLLATDSQKQYNFVGVPEYKQTPAIFSEFNASDSDEPYEKMPDDVKKLKELAKCAFKIKDISNLEKNDCNELEENLKAVCKIFCKNGVAKITSALYYINPNNFVPVNKYTAELFDMPSKCTGEGCEFIEKYIELCRKIKEDENTMNKRRKDNDKIMLFPLISSYAFYSKNVIGEAIANFKNSKNIILSGAPGTGKTYSIKQYLKSKLKENYNDRTCFVQFHPNIDYNEFFEGIRPSNVSGGELKVELQNGIFKEFCKKAFEKPKEEFYFVIDEINRANLSAVFGELLNAIEYRIKFNENNEVINSEDFIETQNSYLIQKQSDKTKKQLSVHNVHKEYIGKFGVPENLYILATMNDIDKSIDSFDLALRRRFVWIEMGFDENVVRFEVKNEPEKLVKKANELNKKIIELMSAKSYEIGHAYFLKIENYDKDDNPYKCLWKYHLEPLIKEYLRTEYPQSEMENHLNNMKEEFIK